MVHQEAGRDRGFIVFAILCFLLLGLVPLFAVLSPSLNMDFAAAGQRASDQSGIAWTSNLANVVRLAQVEPSLWLLILGSAVPTLAAIIAAWMTFGRRGLLELFARFSPISRGATLNTNALNAYLVIPAILLLAMFATRVLRTSIWPNSEHYSFAVIDSSILIPIVTYSILDQGALLEELGWRGFGGPSLEANGFGWLPAAIVVGILWGLWHVPRDLVSGVPVNLGWLVYCFVYLPAFVLKTVAVSILAAAAMKWAGGSVWPAIIAHGITNDAVGLSGQTNINMALTPSHQISGAIPICIATILVLYWITWRQKHLES